MMNIAISACLLGQKVRYDGNSSKNEELLKLLEGHNLFPICPEVMGGLSIPRNPSEIKNDRVFDNNGNDVTKHFLNGSLIALKEIVDNNCQMIILKSKSPSCGNGLIYDGTFTNKLTKGYGFFVKVVKENDILIPIYSEMDIESLKKVL